MTALPPRHTEGAGVIPNRMHFTNMMAVQRSAQMRHQSGEIAIQNVLRQQMMNQQLLLLSGPLPAPPEEGQTVEPDVTSLGLEVSQTYAIKEVLVAEGHLPVRAGRRQRQGALESSRGQPRGCLSQHGLRLTEGEDPNDLPDYT